MDRLHNSERALVSCSVNSARLNGAECSVSGEYGHTRIDDIFFYSRVFGFKSAAGDEKSAVEKLKSDIEAGKLPNNVMIYGGDMTDALTGALKDGGFIMYAAQTSMSLDLPIGAPAGAEIVTIGKELVESWTDSLNRGMGNDPSPACFYENMLKSDDAKLFGILEDGKVVSTLMVCFFDGLPCIHECSTLPETRGRGYISNLVRAACAEAKNRGYDTMYLQASDMGRPVYAKLGFTADGEITHWKLP